MTEGLAPETFSDDQKEALALLAETLQEAGVDITERTADPGERDEDDKPSGRTVAILGKAGSGKTHLLVWLVERLIDSGAKQIVSEQETRRSKKRKRAPEVTFAVVAPTNKAASVLRGRGVAATTIHRIIYSPVYAPEYEAIAAWLAEPETEKKPESIEALSDALVERALLMFKQTKSTPGALAVLGMRASDFIAGWKRRDDRLSIGLVDEASMLDKSQLGDLREIFDVVVLFGDPAQLAPVGQGGAMVFDSLPLKSKKSLSRVHRQAADNPIIDLAYALQEDIAFNEFEDRLRAAAARDDRVVVAPRVDADLMARTPTLVWRNATRVRMIHAFRRAHNLPPDALAPGEPLICDGLEISAKNRNKRVDLEQAGLVKGAQAFWLGEGRKPGFAQLYIAGAPQPKIGVAAIIHIEQPDSEEPFIPTAARQGAVFVHGAACTVHKSQGSQWETVQVFAPDLFAAARSGREEDGVPLWRRLAYVAITRAQHRLVWATRYALAMPKNPLEIDDLIEGPLL